MNVKGTLVRTRLEFLSERFGPDAPARVLATLPARERDALRGALATSWVPFEAINLFDAAMLSELSEGDPDLAREFGVFAAHRYLATVYRIFLEQAAGDPQRLLQGLADLHAALYDWGSVRIVPLAAGRCRVEADYSGQASRTNCLTTVGFYAGALRHLEVTRAQVQERACQATGAPLCVCDVSWES